MDPWPVVVLSLALLALLAAAAVVLLRERRANERRLDELERRNTWLERRVEQQRQAERRLFDGGPVVLVECDGEPPYRLLGASANLQRARGGSAPPLQQPFARLLHPDDAAAFAAAAAEALAAPGERPQRELRLAHADGGWRWHLLQLIAADGGRLHGYLLGTDALRQAETQAAARRRDLEALVQKMSASQRFLQTLQQLGEQLRHCAGEDEVGQLVAGSGPMLFARWDGAISFADADGLMSWAGRWGRFPLPEKACRQADCWALRRGRLHQAQAAVRRERTPVCAHLAGPDGALADGIVHALCVPLLTPGGRPGALHLTAPEALDEEQVRAAGWAAEAMAETLTQALSALQLRASLHEQAVRDWLTGLYNRRFFDEALHREIDRAGRNGDRLTLALLDVDHFKAFNDAFGHHAGDQVLKAVAAQLRGFVRSYDTAARVGGEELALLLPRAALDETCARLDRLRENIAQLALQHDGVALPRITVSIGVAELQPGDAGHALLQRADVALYAAKHDGRNRLRRWLPELAERPAEAAEAGVRRQRRDVER